MRTGSGMLTKVCPVCGCQFQTWPSQNCTHCSRACASQYLSTLYKARYTENPQLHPMLGRKLSEEWRLKVIKAREGKSGWPRGKQPGPFAGKQHTKLSREKISQNRKGIKSPLGTGDKISKSLRQFYNNHPEHRLEVSIKTKEVQSRPGVKERISLALRKAKGTAEARAKNSTIMKRIAREKNYIRHIWDHKDARPNKLENKVALLLQNLGLQAVFQYEFRGFRLDYALPELKLAIMADGCYWHCCPIHFPMARSKAQQRVLSGDQRRNQCLKKAGWRVLHIWECQVGEPATLEHLTSCIKNGKEVSCVYLS